MDIGSAFGAFDRYTTLQSLYTALDHQLQDGLMNQHEFDCKRYIVRKLWDLRLQIHMIEEGIITRSLFVYVCMYLYKR